MLDLSPAALAALQSGHTRPFYLFSLECQTGTLYVWTGIGSLNWNGHTWQGLGAFGSVSPITSTSEVTAENVTVSLSGLDPNIVEIALHELRQGDRADIYIGLLDANNIVIADPTKRFSGYADVPTIEDGGDTCTLSLTIENPLIDLQRAANRRYTPDDQRQEYPDDDGFMFVAGCQQWAGTWGR